MPVLKKKQSKPRTKLTIKQEKFVNEVVKSGSGTKAAKKIYKCKNEQTAHSIGCENLSKPIIKAEIEDRLLIAKNKVFELMRGSEKDEIQLRAAQDIIDRAEGKALARTQLSGELKVVTEDELID